MRADAQTFPVPVMVGDQPYEFNVLSALPGAIPSGVVDTPWWNSSDVSDFVSAYEDATVGLRSGSTYFGFFDLGGGSVLTVELFAAGGDGLLAVAPGDILGGSFVTATAVPEIDGPVLARMALVLFALYLGIKIIRQRRFGEVATA